VRRSSLWRSSCSTPNGSATSPRVAVGDWLNHAISCDDAVVAMIEHIESEIKLKRGNAAHRRILDRLAELHEAFP
jgi:hypothetical protein